ncbi:alpha/beta fold hydrolase [Novosphingobium album (ex Hu et al. 2023)]|uniref:Alpha/beta fold hydrolase n=1 Tax=Novosphingobium album (ex Hu et al. 2023) TaxID=2930093 RepID=A0ABT0B615_9SPHN|nr:alpha/beta hydrolase [Novosphingobium album (ex Hu et al. 2023)]MCJ2180490.1 alpha/beta fold hydrolase [Novosphingobium album (ex Hu et al. 2023)]
MANSIRKRYVDLPEGQLHIREVAGGEPPIVFLHQTACSAQSYDPLLAELRLPNRLLALDTPGFGGSFDPEGWPSLEDYAGWFLAALDALDIERFHAFGHHTGSSLAMLLAARHPGRVISIMLAGAELMTPEERAEFRNSHGEPFTPQSDGSHLMLNWNYAAGYNQDVAPELLHGEVVAMLRAWRGRPQAYRAVADADTPALAPHVHAPVLLLTSSEDYFHKDLNRATALFPDARVVTTGGGNFQATADPGGVARAVEHFITAL